MPTTTVNSLYCGHPRDCELVSLIAKDRNSKNVFQSNVCALFLLRISNVAAVHITWVSVIARYLQAES